jgi:hypothetical protein
LLPQLLPSVWERLQKTLTFVAYIIDMITLLDGNPGRNREAHCISGIIACIEKENLRRSLYNGLDTDKYHVDFPKLL